MQQNGSGVTMYLDGREVGHRANPLAVMQNAEPLIIGREAWGGDPSTAGENAFFTGRIDDVQIWPRARPAAEIALGCCKISTQRSRRACASSELWRLEVL